MQDTHVPRAPGALPLVGHAWQMLTDPTGFLASLPRYGDLVEVRLGTRRTLVVCTPDLVAHVLRRSHHEFDKGGPFFDNIADFLGDGLATCPNAKHTRLRRLTQPAFHRTRIGTYSDTVTREATEVTDRWREGQVLDAYRVMQELAMRIIVSTMFTAWPSQLGFGRSVGEILRNVNILINGAFLRMVAPPALSRLPLPANRRYASAKAALDRMVDDIVAAYRRNEKDQGDLLSMLLGSDGDGDRLSDGEIREQVITMFIAGIGTVAAMLSWTLHYLSLDPTLDAAIAAEVAQVTNRHTVSYEDVPHLGMLDKTVTETLRIAPAAWLYSRIAIADTMLDRYAIPGGATILLSPYILHHRPDLFPDPQQFDPSRWDGADLATSERASIMAPFGAGPRKCVGQHFAITNITLVLANILVRWRLAPAAARPVRALGRSALVPRGLFLRLSRR